jgi:hypothetical protein
VLLESEQTISRVAQAITKVAAGVLT